MKKVSIFDLIFIVVSTLIILLIYHFEYSTIITRYIIVVILIAYFSGKYLNQLEIKRMKDKENKNK